MDNKKKQTNNIYSIKRKHLLKLRRTQLSKLTLNASPFDSKASVSIFPRSSEGSSWSHVPSWCGHKEDLNVTQSSLSVSHCLNYTSLLFSALCLSLHLPEFLASPRPYVNYIHPISWFLHVSHLCVTRQVSLATFPTIARDSELTASTFHMSQPFFKK